LDDTCLSILLFADDIALISDSEESLQAMPDSLSEWCYKWRLQINPDKTKVMHFRPVSVPMTDFNFKCCNSPIAIVDSYKYLGLNLNENLDLEKIAKSVAKSAQRALGLLIAKHKALGGMPHDVFSKLYDALVSPVIEYAASIWGHREFSSITTIQNRACRFFMGVTKFTPNMAVQGDMGWKQVFHRQKICVTRLWLRLINMDRNRISSKVFWYAYGQAQNGFKNWCFFTMKMFDDMGLPNLKYAINCIQKPVVLDKVNDKLSDDTRSKWIENLNREVRVGRNKLRTYRLFKNEFSTEMYLKCI
jgi:hypothetical protein